MQPLVLVVFLVAIACVGAITSGSDAAQGQFPYEVLIEMQDYGNWRQYRCGGAILSEYWVVTSARCTQLMGLVPPSDVHIVVMAGQVDRDGTDHRQSLTSRRPNQHRHPDYVDGISAYDIGLMKLDTSFEFNPYVQPLKLPENGAIPSGKAYLIGWGDIIENGTQTLPQYLQYSPVEIIDSNECKELWDEALNGTGENPFDFVYNICSGPTDSGVGTCSGDRGSLLVQDGTLVGIGSWNMQELNIPCGTKGVPSTYCKVSSFLSFIGGYMNGCTA